MQLVALLGGEGGGEGPRTRQQQAGPAGKAWALLKAVRDGGVEGPVNLGKLAAAAGGLHRTAARDLLKDVDEEWLRAIQLRDRWNADQVRGAVRAREQPVKTEAGAETQYSRDLRVGEMRELLAATDHLPAPPDPNEAFGIKEKHGPEIRALAAAADGAGLHISDGLETTLLFAYGAHPVANVEGERGVKAFKKFIRISKTTGLALLQNRVRCKLSDGWVWLPAAKVRIFRKRGRVREGGRSQGRAAMKRAKQEAQDGRKFDDDSINAKRQLVQIGKARKKRKKTGKKKK